MQKRFFQLILIGFMIAYFIDFALINFFYAKTSIEFMDSHIDLNAISMLKISGEDLKEINNYCEQGNLDFCSYLSGIMLKYDYQVPSLNDKLTKYNKLKKDTTLENIYHMVFDDIRCFPVIGNKEADEDRYNYTDTFLADRTYGGERKHMGTDIMDLENEGGYFNIVSMTDGVIENIGWLELGGYRIGIRSESGAYFYYAHLHDYADNLSNGAVVKAGQLLGHMGSTGYGSEGTHDQFPVHLHMGIALNLDNKEVWINPFAILQMLDPKVTTVDN